MLNTLRPWAERHKLDVADEQLLEAFGGFESEHEVATPAARYPQILAGVFEDIAQHFGVVAEPSEAEAFGRSVKDWPAFPDSPEALRHLKQHQKLVIISNVDRDSFAHSEAKLGVKFDAIITAEDVGSYKPSLRNFEYAFDRLAKLGVRRDRILHVAQSLFHDHLPAKQAGPANRLG